MVLEINIMVRLRVPKFERSELFICTAYHGINENNARLHSNYRSFC